MKKLIRKVRSFTLVEILVVMSIIGILFSSGMLGISMQYKKARDAKRKIDLDQMKKAMDEYFDTVGHYPDTLPPCATPFTIGDDVLLSAIPCDPKNKSDYLYLTSAPNEEPWYKLYTKLEYAKDSSIELVGCQNGCGPNCEYNYGVSSSNAFLMLCMMPVPTIIPTMTPSPSPTTTPIPIVSLTSSPVPTETPASTNDQQQIMYVCAPGGGDEGFCEAYDDPERSECPKVYPDNHTCNNQCGDKQNRCKNASGKNKPE